MTEAEKPPISGMDWDDPRDVARLIRQGDDYERQRASRRLWSMLSDAQAEARWYKAECDRIWKESQDGPPVPRKAVSPSEAADALGISRAKVYEELTAGRIRSVRSGKRRLIPVAALDEWLESLPDGNSP